MKIMTDAEIKEPQILYTSGILVEQGCIESSIGGILYSKHFSNCAAIIIASNTGNKAAIIHLDQPYLSDLRNKNKLPIICGSILGKEGILIVSENSPLCGLIPRIEQELKNYGVHRFQIIKIDRKDQNWHLTYDLDRRQAIIDVAINQTEKDREFFKISPFSQILEVEVREEDEKIKTGRSNLLIEAEITHPDVAPYFIDFFDENDELSLENCFEAFKGQEITFEELLLIGYKHFKEDGSKFNVLFDNKTKYGNGFFGYADEDRLKITCNAIKALLSEDLTDIGKILLLKILRGYCFEANQMFKYSSEENLLKLNNYFTEFKSFVTEKTKDTVILKEFEQLSQKFSLNLCNDQRSQLSPEHCN